MKKCIYFFILLILLFVPIDSFAMVNPTDRFYINDYAGILSNDTKDYIFEHSKNLDTKTTSQIVVVTVPSLEGEVLEEYATSLFRKFGIGDSKENNGLLILLALEERQVRVEVGYGLEGILNDAKTGRMLDEYMIPLFKKDNFDEGMLNGYKAFYKELVNYYGITEEVDEPVGQYYSIDIASIINLIFIVGNMIAMIVIIVKLKKGEIGRVGSFRTYGGRSHHHRRSRSSSFRGFSGRGGSSGGGGSSRGF